MELGYFWTAIGTATISILGTIIIEEIRLHYKRSDLKERIAKFEEAVDKQRDCIQLCAAGVDHLLTTEYREAISRFMEVTALLEDKTLGISLVSKSLELSGDRTNAISWISKVIDSGKARSAQWSFRGFLYYSLGELKFAEFDHEQAVLINSRNIFSVKQLVSVYYLSRNLRGVVQNVARLRNEFGDREFEDLGRVAALEERNAENLNAGGFGNESNYERILAGYLQQGDFRFAKELINRAEENHVETYRVSLMRFYLGLAQKKIDFEELENLDPSELPVNKRSHIQSSIRLIEGHCHFLQQKFAAAEITYSQLVKAEGFTETALHNRFVSSLYDIMTARYESISDYSESPPIIIRLRKLLTDLKLTNERVQSTQLTNLERMVTALLHSKSGPLGNDIKVRKCFVRHIDEKLEGAIFAPFLEDFQRMISAYPVVKLSMRKIEDESEFKSGHAAARNGP